MRIQSPLAQTDQPLANVAGWGINVRNLDDAVKRIANAAQDGDGFVAVAINLDVLVKLRSSAAFRKACSVARFITADGAPVAHLARRQHAGIERTTGADLLVPLSMEAARRGLPIYLFGSADETLSLAGADLAERSGGRLAIAGTWSPTRNFDPEGPEADEAIARIRDSGAKICFLALGAPKQEIFAARALQQGVRVGFVCVGAAVDFVARKQIRAPQFMQRNGLEWLWRLSTNPRRLAVRYAKCALVLTDIEIVSPLRERGRDLFGTAARR
jgi:exopolysaccharide biosynthesis WecB/TagA/CpsF family protein